MADIEILLASNSPRRRQLLSWTGLKFRVCPANINEDLKPAENADEYVLRLAESKARSAQKFAKPHEIVLAADTIVVDGKEILGKPMDEVAARGMLVRLRGNVHHVITAIAVLDPLESILRMDKSCSPVRMRRYQDDEITQYIASRDPFDKAGGYAIQHPVFDPVEAFHDCFASVMGLPLCHFVRTMREMGFDIKADVPNNCQTQLQYDCPVFDLILKDN